MKNQDIINKAKQEMKKNEKVKINFWGLIYETENPTNKGIIITILVLLFLCLVVFF